jgi:serine phosphatase RsbU (regulator of sigma subunit)
MDFAPVSDVRPSPRENGNGAQAARLPVPTTNRFYTLDAVSRPLTEFSGDFYFYSEVRGDLWFALGDFAGHGLSAAIYSAMIQEELARAIEACPFADPAEVVASLHSTLLPEFPFNRFASLVVGRMRPDNSLQLANAGHPHAVIRRSDGTIEVVDPHGPVVGLLPIGRWGQSEHVLRCGDRLLIHSDGLIEGTSADEEVGSARVWEWVRQSDPQALRDEVLQKFDSFTSGAQSDDVTVMVVSAA